MDGAGVDIYDHNISESGKHLRRLCLHQDRCIDSCRAAILSMELVHDHLSSSDGLLCVLYVSTLDSDVSDAAAVVAHLHLETAQYGQQLEGEDVAVFGSFSHYRRRHFLSDTDSLTEQVVDLRITSLVSPVRLCSVFSTCLFGSWSRAAVSCGGRALLR